MLVMQSIFGNWDCSLGSVSLLSSSLLDIIAKHNLASSYMSFSTSYLDTGWGIYLVSENLGKLNDLMHFALREWTRMSIAPTTVEVECAKSQLKASLLLRLDGTMAIAEDIGQQLVTSGQRMTPRQIENAIDVVNPDEIKRLTQKYLWDKDVRLLLSLYPTYSHGPDVLPPLVRPPTNPTPWLDHFIAYALHRTRLHSSVTFAALYLLQCLKARFPAAMAMVSYTIIWDFSAARQKMMSYVQFTTSLRGKAVALKL